MLTKMYTRWLVAVTVLVLSSALPAAEKERGTMGHGGHKGMQHAPMDQGQTSTGGQGALTPLKAVPPSGKAREAGFDGHYGMEPTSAERDLVTRCAQASRGLIVLDNASWTQCGGKAKGIPTSPVGEQHAGTTPGGHGVAHGSAVRTQHSMQHQKDKAPRVAAMGQHQQMQHGQQAHGEKAPFGMPEHDDKTPHETMPPGHQHGKGEQHGMPQHDDKAQHTATTGQHGQMQYGPHRHDRWVTPPPEYANKRSTRWTDPEAITRGKQLFLTNCLVCHGLDGRGTGPAAKGLPHPPTDLTNHFHRQPGDGDAYLFWRVSEGGQVEPFKSMQSAMPPFKTVLSEEQRWDVLAYVHAAFHKGFKEK